jgi:hypothetical protein
MKGSGVMRPSSSWHLSKWTICCEANSPFPWGKQWTIPSCSKASTWPIFWCS